MVTSAPFVRFARFVQERGWSQEEAAGALGVHQTTISLLLRQKRRPGLELALAIERATAVWDEGPIEASEWSGASLAPTGTDGE